MVKVDGKIINHIMKHLNKFNEEFGQSEYSSPEDRKEVSTFLKSQIKVAFENTVLCARTNSPQESYDYAERMAEMVIRMIEEGK